MNNAYQHITIQLCQDQHHNTIHVDYPLKHVTKANLVNFHHGILFSPVKLTLVRSIKNGHLVTCPGLDSKVVNRHLHPSIHTDKGHLNQQRQKLQSTQQTALPLDNNEVIKVNCENC